MFYKKAEFEGTELAERLWEISQASYEFGSPWKKEQFLEDLAQPQTDYLLVVKQQEIVAFLGYSVVLDEAEITNIVVHPNWKKLGIGHQLLNKFFKELESCGCTHVFLEVRKSNEAAKYLYQAEKFRSLGLRKGYYKEPLEDAIIMSAKVRLPHV